MYSEGAAPPVDPYSDAYNAPPATAAATATTTESRDPPRGRSRSRSPPRSAGYRSPPFRGGPKGRTPPPRRPPHAPIAPNPSSVLGVFGLSIRTTERDLDEEFSRFGHVEKVTIVYDQRSDRSRGFGFIRMSAVEEATKCINELNGVDLNGRRIRVDYSVTDRPHAPTPGEYMGHRRSSHRDSYYGRDGGRDGRDIRDYRDGRDRDRGRGYSNYDKDRDRDPYGRDSRDRDRDWRRSPPARRHSPDSRRSRSHSRSPPRASSPARAARDFDGPNESSRW